MSTKKADQTVVLARRPATLSNLNLSPEKHGEELVERMDLSLAFNVQGDDLAQVLRTSDGNTLGLWADDGDLRFSDVSALVTKLEAEGELSIGTSVNSMLTFSEAKLTKVKVQPFVERQAEVKCKIRIDPTGNMEALGQMLITRDVVMTYQGGKAKDDNQAELSV